MFQLEFFSDYLVYLIVSLQLGIFMGSRVPWLQINAICRIFLNAILFLFFNNCLLTNFKEYVCTVKNKPNLAVFKVL